MIRLVYFIWVVVPVAVYLTYRAIGLPYLNWSYDFRSAGGYDPWSERTYTRCTYASPTLDYITIYPTDGHCARIRFFPQNGGGA